MIELSNSQKKIAREIIREGMNIECKTFLDNIDKWIKAAYQPEETPHSRYLKLYEEVETFDEQFAFKYDSLSASKYLLLVARLIYDRILPEERIMKFSEEVQLEIFRLLNIYKEIAASKREKDAASEEE